MIQCQSRKFLLILATKNKGMCHFFHDPKFLFIVHDLGTFLPQKIRRPIKALVQVVCDTLSGKLVREGRESYQDSDE